ncbi:hypothetical protein KIH39_00060 [Telmatocola sphagniphila]|uniref:Uncharacterized protein n=1 Tax=Telmatocola sphagniphila TaxID=1123043 RepID=A0A8E6EY60_9BACT|nr:hypothetical protein [Telmatocola sphagniphila]QVL32348.1 hypothetical protein KIH39_00060 [Telmatocola sphagniphila]
MSTNKKKMRNAAIISAPKPLDLGGNTILVGHPGVDDQATMYSWARVQAIAAKAKLRGLLTDEDLDGLSPARQAVLIDRFAKAKASGAVATVNDDDLQGVLMSAPGVRMMVYLASRRYSPEITQKDLESLITEENAMAVFIAFWQATTDPIEPDTDPELAERLSQDPATGLPN